MKDCCPDCGLKYFVFRGKVSRHCKCQDEKMTKQSYLMNDSFIESYFMNNDFKVVDDELKPYLENFDWVSNRKDITAKEPDYKKWSTKSLFISGASGSYKTGQVTAIAKEFMLKELRGVRYYQSREIVFQKDQDFIKTVPLLILDNLGKDREFEEKFGNLFALINFRVYNYLSTIVISDEVKEFNKAIESRFKMFNHILIKRTDMR